MIVAKPKFKVQNNNTWYTKIGRGMCSIDAIIDAMAAHNIDSGTFAAALLSLWQLKIAALYFRDNY